MRRARPKKSRHLRSNDQLPNNDLSSFLSMLRIESLIPNCDNELGKHESFYSDGCGRNKGMVRIGNTKLSVQSGHIVRDARKLHMHPMQTLQSASPLRMHIETMRNR